MNKQEIEMAIHDLENLRTCKGISSNCFEEMHGKNLEVAISALEKQMPKKAVEIRERHNFRGEVIFKDGYCPSCKNEMSSAYFYCNKCGQAIDWRNKDE